jgi:hypothetical protein
VIHKVTTDFDEFQAVRAHEAMVVPPVKVLEERGTEIRSVLDQAKLLQYWAWLQQPIEVGPLLPEANYTVEYWMSITLQPVPGDDDPTTYHRILKELWMERLRGISQGLAQGLASMSDDFRVRVRYIFNGLRIWFVPNGAFQADTNRSLAEDPCPKDKWYSTSDLMAFAFPTMPDSQVREEPSILFGPGSRLQEWQFSRESAILSATSDAVASKHALEHEGSRKGQRVVIYPKDLPQLEAVLSTGYPNIDSEDGYPIAYAAILQAAQSHERPPLFLREDSEQITSDPAMAEKVPGWMNTAAQVATGNRRRVLEDGPDKMNSDEEDAIKEEHGDK